VGGIWVVTVPVTVRTEIESCFTIKDKLEVPEECIKIPVFVALWG
jgi:hypothetical protein